MPSPKKRRFQINQQRKKKTKKKKLETNLMIKSGFSLNAKKTFKIYNKLILKFSDFYETKRVPSLSEVKEINFSIREMKSAYNFIFIESLELEKVLGKGKVKNIRHDLKENFFILRNWIELLEKKFGKVGFEKLGT
ncbi:MAG: hypothetical protein COT90_03880 [Candidatus Diapherotrites archaeon CG10_big_fil_rev_8_21_14_0_10_31_34]|nr:MAG: hypothetical protein COT90_03880 [Candidatus Diapherotrites archaeon CG10_big_fil_rev_8_21_14_0_10_31_34]